MGLSSLLVIKLLLILKSACRVVYPDCVSGNDGSRLGLGVRCTGSASVTTRVCSRRLIPSQGFIKTNSTYWLSWDLTLRRSYYTTSPSPLGWNRCDGLLLYLHSSLCCVFEVMTTSLLFADWIDFSTPAVLWSFVVWIIFLFLFLSSRDSLEQRNERTCKRY